MIHELLTDDDGDIIDPWINPEKYDNDNGVVVRDYYANPDKNGAVESRVLFICPISCPGPDGDAEPEDGLPHSIYFAYENRLPCPEHGEAHREFSVGDDPRDPVMEANYMCHHCDWNAADGLMEMLDVLEKTTAMAHVLPKLIDNATAEFDKCDECSRDHDHDVIRDEFVALGADVKGYADAMERRWNWLLTVLPSTLTCSDDIAVATGHLVTTAREYERLRAAMAKSSSVAAFVDLDGE